MHLNLVPMRRKSLHLLFGQPCTDLNNAISGAFVDLWFFLLDVIENSLSQGSGAGANLVDDQIFVRVEM